MSAQSASAVAWTRVLSPMNVATHLECSARTASTAGPLASSERQEEPQAAPGAAAGGVSSLVADSGRHAEPVRPGVGGFADQSHPEAVGVRHVRQLDDGREAQALRGLDVHLAEDPVAEGLD